MKTALFERFELDMTLDTAKCCSHQGQCDDDVDAVLETNTDKIVDQLDVIGPDKIRAELKEFGAWDAEELADDAENRARIVWIAAGNIREESHHPHLV